MIERFLPRTEFSSYEDLYENYRVIIPPDFNFGFDVIDAWAAEQPDRLALIWCDDFGHERRYTFTDLMHESDRMVHFFQRHGVRKGDSVLLTLKQHPEAWIAFIALHKLGAITIPATYQLMPKDIIYRCNAAKVKMVVTVDDEELLGNYLRSRGECTTLEHIAVVGDGPVPEGCLDLRTEMAGEDPSFQRPTGEAGTVVTDPMLIYFSSGTTGMPKMILHDYSYPLGHITTAKYWHHVQDGGLHMTVADSGWAKFGWGKIYGQWICGAVIVAYDYDKFNAHNMLTTMDRLGLSTFCAPPTIYRFFIKEDLSLCDWSKLSHCCIAGEPLNPEVYERFLQATGLPVTEGFGQSETSVILANYEWFDVKPGSTGKPSPLYDIAIVDDDGNECEDGIVGNIVVRGLDKYWPPGLFKCYLGDDEANARAFRHGMYYTGDTAWRDGDGYYWFVGRNDDVIKCSGYRIGPFEVESALLTHPAVLECAVTAAPDPVRGQVVKATVVLARGYQPSDELRRELQDHVKKVTAPYKYPRILEFADDLPKTLSGKIRRVQIRQEDAAAAQK